VARLAPRQLQSRYDWIAAEARTEPLEVAILSVDPRSGGIRALVGGRDYNLSSFDRAQYMRRQPGSAFKPFAYLPAIASKRATPATLLLDAPLSVDVSDHETWSPHNYDEQYRGRVTVREAFEKSLNVPTIRLSEDIGVRRVANNRRAVRLRREVPRHPGAAARRDGSDVARAYRRLHRLPEPRRPGRGRTWCGRSVTIAASRSSSTRP